MVSLTLSVDTELKSRMDAFPEMNWSAVARSAIMKKLDFMETLGEITKNSELTEDDALRLGKQVKAGIARRFEAAHEASDRRKQHNSSAGKGRKNT